MANQTEKTVLEQAREARRAYQREYAKKNRDKMNAANRKWAHKNPEKVRANQLRYWMRKAQQQTDEKENA